MAGILRVTSPPCDGLSDVVGRTGRQKEKTLYMVEPNALPVEPTSDVPQAGQAPVGAVSEGAGAG